MKTNDIKLAKGIEKLLKEQTNFKVLRVRNTVQVFTVSGYYHVGVMDILEDCAYWQPLKKCVYDDRIWDFFEENSIQAKRCSCLLDNKYYKS